jgi:hypothetical protein
MNKIAITAVYLEFSKPVKKHGEGFDFIQQVFLPKSTVQKTGLKDALFKRLYRYMP